MSASPLTGISIYVSNSSAPGSGELCGNTDDFAYYLSSPDGPDVHVMVECQKSLMGQYVTLKKKVNFQKHKYLD